MDSQSSAPESLSAAEFDDNADFLLQVGRSRNVTVRRNTLIAWRELLRVAPDRQREQSAIARMVDLVLAEGLSSEESGELIKTARSQFADLDPYELHCLRNRLGSEITIRRGAERGGNAAALAIGLVSSPTFSKQGFGVRTGLMFKSYLELLRIAQQRWVILLRDIAPLLAVILFFMIVSINYGLQYLAVFVNHSKSLTYQADPIGYGVFFSIICAMLSVSTLRPTTRFIFFESAVFSFIVTLIALVFSATAEKPDWQGAVILAGIGIFVARSVSALATTRESAFGSIAASIFSWFAGVTAAVGLQYLAGVTGLGLDESRSNVYVILIMVAFGALGGNIGRYRFTQYGVMDLRPATHRAAKFVCAVSAVAVILTVNQAGTAAQTANRARWLPILSHVGGATTINCKVDPFRISDIYKNKYYKLIVTPECAGLKLSAESEVVVSLDPYSLDAKNIEYKYDPDDNIVLIDKDFHILKGPDGRSSYSSKMDKSGVYYVCVGRCDYIRANGNVNEIISEVAFAWRPDLISFPDSQNFSVSEDAAYAVAAPTNAADAAEAAAAQSQKLSIGPTKLTEQDYWDYRSREIESAGTGGKISAPDGQVKSITLNLVITPEK